MSNHGTGGPDGPISIDRQDVGIRIVERFGERLLLSMSEAARILEIDVKTLRRHVRAGNIIAIELGFGTCRPRRRFTQSALEAFLHERQAKTLGSSDGSAAAFADARNRIQTRLRNMRSRI